MVYIVFFVFCSILGTSEKMCANGLTPLAAKHSWLSFTLQRTNALCIFKPHRFEGTILTPLSKEFTDLT